MILDRTRIEAAPGGPTGPAQDTVARPYLNSMKSRTRLGSATGHVPVPVWETVVGPLPIWPKCATNGPMARQAVVKSGCIPGSVCVRASARVEAGDENTRAPHTVGDVGKSHVMRSRQSRTGGRPSAYRSRMPARLGTAPGGLKRAPLCNVGSVALGARALSYQSPSCAPRVDVGPTPPARRIQYFAASGAPCGLCVAKAMPSWRQAMPQLTACGIATNPRHRRAVAVAMPHRLCSVKNREKMAQIIPSLCAAYAPCGRLDAARLRSPSRGLGATGEARAACAEKLLPSNATSSVAGA